MSPKIKKTATKSSTKKVSPKTLSKKKVPKTLSAKKPEKLIAKNNTIRKDKTVSKKTELDKEKLVAEARTKKGATPSIFKIKSRKSTPIVFSLEEVQNLLKGKKPSVSPKKEEKKEKPVIKKTEQRIVKKELPKDTFKDYQQPSRVLGAASLADILGFNPNETKSRRKEDVDENKIPKNLLKYYKSLIELRQHVLDGLEMHTKETLKRSSKEDAGDLSGYGQHMADAGTDTFDRDFALNLLSSEQDALFEIEEAIQRILAGTYGICEITGTKISNERLMAVPFTRYGLEGQKQLESTQRTNKERGSVFGEASLEETAKFAEDFEE